MSRVVIVKPLTRWLECFLRFLGFISNDKLGGWLLQIPSQVCWQQKTWLSTSKVWCHAIYIQAHVVALASLVNTRSTTSIFFKHDPELSSPNWREVNYQIIYSQCPFNLKLCTTASFTISYCTDWTSWTLVMGWFTCFVKGERKFMSKLSLMKYLFTFIVNVLQKHNNALHHKIW